MPVKKLSTFVREDKRLEKQMDSASLALMEHRWKACQVYSQREYAKAIGMGHLDRQRTTSRRGNCGRTREVSRVLWTPQPTCWSWRRRRLLHPAVDPRVSEGAERPGIDSQASGRRHPATDSELQGSVRAASRRTYVPAPPPTFPPPADL